MELLSTSLRPRKLSDVYGQPNIINELQKAWSKGGFPQALLLKGPTGSGKTTVAQIIAMMLNCHNPKSNGDPCCECSSCLSIINEKFDQNTYRLDGSSSSKSDVIDFSALASIAPFYNKNNIFIIEESDQLSIQAKNSLLKVLETPYKNTYFILLSMYPTGLPAAIQSRCQVKNFKYFKPYDILLALQNFLKFLKKWDIPEIPKSFYLEVLPAIADASQGSLREAIRLLETCLTSDYYTKEQILDSLGLVSEASINEIIIKLLNRDFSIFQDFDNIDIKEFFNLGYYTLSNAAQYKLTHTTSNEYYENYTKQISESPRLLKLLQIFDEIQLGSDNYIKKSFLISKLTQYYMSFKLREVDNE
jgi:DNA polymerase III subunit gamma/tau